MIEVDARGLSCPEPVMLAMQAMEANGGQAIRVLVSSSIARDNVQAMASKKKRSATASRLGDDFAIVIE